MRNQGQILMGVVLVVAGVLFLIGSVFDVDFGTLCFPTGLILLGVWLLLRPQLLGPQTAFRWEFFGPARRKGAWQVADEEVWLLIGDVILDMTEAEIPLGETSIRVFSFVSTVRLLVPEGVGVAVASTAFVTDAKFLGKKREGFLTTTSLTSDGYETAERKVRLETTCFVADLKVRQA